MHNVREMRGREMVARVFLAVLGVLNLWVSYVIRAAHPVLAAVNAVMAAALLLALLVDVMPRAPGRMGEK
jgi:zinc transporter ZupT